MDAVLSLFNSQMVSWKPIAGVAGPFFDRQTPISNWNRSNCLAVLYHQHTMNFPLYDSLISGIPAKTVKDLKPTEKKFFVDNVAALNQEGKELIYALIVVFHIKNETVVDDSINLPYKGKFVETGVLEFNFNLFPAKLKHILHKFMVLHLAATENAARPVV